jgi:hypothetical protein
MLFYIYAFLSLIVITYINMMLVIAGYLIFRNFFKFTAFYKTYPTVSKYFFSIRYWITVVIVQNIMCGILTLFV